MASSVPTLQDELLVSCDGAGCTQLGEEKLEHMLLCPVDKLANLREVGKCNLLGTNSLNLRRTKLDRHTLTGTKRRIALLNDTMNAIEEVIICI